MDTKDNNKNIQQGNGNNEQEHRTSKQDMHIKQINQEKKKTYLTNVWNKVVRLHWKRGLVDKQNKIDNDKTRVKQYIYIYTHTHTHNQINKKRWLI